MPIEFRCAQCQKLLQTPDETAGKQAKCPQCGTIQQIPSPTTAPPPASPFAPGTPSLGPAAEAPSGAPSGQANPYQSPGDYGTAPTAWSDPSYLRTYALDRVSTPATLLIVTGSLGLVLQVLGAVVNVIQMVGLGAVQPGAGGGMEMLLLSGGFGVVSSLIGIAISTIVILGGLKMKRLESHTWAMTSAIVALIPCISPCCLLGLPFGVWALVVLNDPQVRMAFRQ